MIINQFNQYQLEIELKFQKHHFKQVIKRMKIIIIKIRKYPPAKLEFQI
jgi:hypothetical protein